MQGQCLDRVDDPAARGLGGRAWVELAAELAHWADGSATFWWRDDDAVTLTPALEQLLALADETPLALAVVPEGADPALRDWFERTGGRITVVQHGWAHRNHGHERKTELGCERPPEAVLAELDVGRERLASLYGRHFMPVLVPPWNRIDAALLPHLAGRHCGLSQNGPRRAAAAAPGVVQANIHADLIDWRHGAGFVGEVAALDALTGHLAGRRTGAFDVREPTGILTHHLVQDSATSRFLETLLSFLRAQPAARWSTAHEIFGPP